MEIAISGGGIAGLTAALSLAAAGFRPTVYEAVERPAPLGVGINLLPHAVRELTELGLLDKLLTLGVAIDDLVYRMADGRDVLHEPRGLAAGYEWPQIAIHRGRFQMFLMDEVRAQLGDDALRFGRKLVGLESRADGVTARFGERADGYPGIVEADLLIGADGIHSAVRRHFYPDEGTPKWNGVSLFRATTRLPAAQLGATMIWAGHSSQKFAAYPIARDPVSGDMTLNWICDLKQAEAGSVPHEDWNRGADAVPLIERYADWCWSDLDVPKIVAAAEAIYEFPMVDRDPLPQWTHGRATLIGDAAHPMYPIGSNGATQAIIDARAIAFHLATAPDIDEALQRYEAERRPATSRIVLMNRAHGPDRVLEVALEHAGSADLDAAFPVAEREAIGQEYKTIAGFDPAALSARASYSVG